MMAGEKKLEIDLQLPPFQLERTVRVEFNMANITAVYGASGIGKSSLLQAIAGFNAEAGVIRFDAIASTGAVRVEVPFLNYSQVVVGASANILLRVEPRPLPSGIP